MKSRKGAGCPRALPHPPHEVDKRHRLSKGSPPPSTRSQQKTQAMRHGIYQLHVSFSGGARPGGRWPGGLRGRTAKPGGRSTRPGARADRSAGSGRSAAGREAGGRSTLPGGAHGRRQDSVAPPANTKRCGPARMHRPTAVWSKHQS